MGFVIKKDNISKIQFKGNPELIWGAFEEFSKYAFNKSHAVAYSIIGYQTAKIWNYKRDQFLQYCLNDGTKKRYDDAMAKLRELKYEFVYPDITNMKGDKFIVEDGKVYIPGNAEKTFDSYVEFLFGDNNSIANLIYKGVCDKLTKDRFALATLATSLLNKYRDQALFMEPSGEKFTKIEQVLNGLLQIGALTEIKKDKDEQGSQIIKVYVRRMRGNPTEIIFHSNNSDFTKYNLYIYDKKMYGNTRKGILNDLPFINTVGIERSLENIKNRLIERGNANQVYYKMRDELQRYMQDNFSSPFRSEFKGLYATLNEVIEYSNNVKLIVNFNDRQEILYISKNLARQCNLARFSKKAMVKLDLKYSPFIQRRTEKFIYDFDILNIQEVKF